MVQYCHIPLRRMRNSPSNSDVRLWQDCLTLQIGPIGGIVRLPNRRNWRWQRVSRIDFNSSIQIDDIHSQRRHPHFLMLYPVNCWSMMIIFKANWKIAESFDLFHLYNVSQLRESGTNFRVRNFPLTKNVLVFLILIWVYWLLGSNNASFVFLQFCSHGDTLGHSTCQLRFSICFCLFCCLVSRCSSKRVMSLR